VVGFLRKGPAWIAEETAGKLVVAGPFEDNVDLRGMFIVNVSSVEEVRAMAEADPAIQSHRLVLELHPWFAGKGFKVVQ